MNRKGKGKEEMCARQRWEGKTPTNQAAQVSTTPCAPQAGQVRGSPVNNASKTSKRRKLHPSTYARDATQYHDIEWTKWRDQPNAAYDNLAKQPIPQERLPAQRTNDESTDDSEWQTQNVLKT
jgi:hypothetical protein